MIYGITIDDIDRLMRNPATLKAVKALPFRPLARVVIDNGRPLTDYLAPVERLHKYADIMIQVNDSYDEKSLSVKQYVEKTRNLVHLFKERAACWEVGNEVNGAWCSDQVWEKVWEASSIIHGQNLRTAITYFLDETMVPFIQENKPFFCDYGFISAYPEHTRMLDQMLRDLPGLLDLVKQTTGAQEVGIGEYGEEEWVGGGFSPRGVRDLLVRIFDKMNGGFYWNFQKHCVPVTQSLFGRLKDTWKKRT